MWIQKTQGIPGTENWNDVGTCDGGTREDRGLATLLWGSPPATREQKGGCESPLRKHHLRGGVAVFVEIVERERGGVQHDGFRESEGASQFHGVDRDESTDVLVLDRGAASGGRIVHDGGHECHENGIGVRVVGLRGRHRSPSWCVEGTLGKKMGWTRVNGVEEIAKGCVQEQQETSGCEGQWRRTEKKKNVQAARARRKKRKMEVVRCKEKNCVNTCNE